MSQSIYLPNPGGFHIPEGTEDEVKAYRRGVQACLDAVLAQGYFVRHNSLLDIIRPSQRCPSINDKASAPSGAPASYAMDLGVMKIRGSKASVDALIEKARAIGIEITLSL